MKTGGGLRVWGILRRGVGGGRREVGICKFFPRVEQNDSQERG